MTASRVPMQDVEAGRRAIMRSNRRRDTVPELAVRRAVHAAGMRYRVDLPIRVPGDRPIRPDLVFTRQRIAVFIDGCFWHGCPLHGTRPATRADFWAEKIATNRARDARQEAALADDGWTVLRVWEHEDPDLVARRIGSLVRAAREGSSAPR